MVRTRRERSIRRRKTTRRLKGGMLKRLFGKKAAPAAPAPAAPANEFNNGYTTRNGRRFENLTANNIAGLAPNNRARYNAFELEMLAAADEFDAETSAAGGGGGAAEANNTQVQNSTANGRSFNSLRSANIAALAAENRRAYNEWKRLEDELKEMEAAIHVPVDPANKEMYRQFGQSPEMNAAVDAALAELEAEAAAARPAPAAAHPAPAAARPAPSIENLLRELENL